MPSEGIVEGRWAQKGAPRGKAPPMFLPPESKIQEREQKLCAEAWLAWRLDFLLARTYNTAYSR